MIFLFIKHLKIKNYRNLDNIEIYFSKGINYIVGDNNIGKTNLLKLFNKLFNTAFTEGDYLRKNKRIVIELTLDLNLEECPFFKFNHKNGEVNLIITQGIYESIPLLIDGNTQKKYDYKVLKKIIFKELSNQATSAYNQIPQERLKVLLQKDFQTMNLKMNDGLERSNQLYLTMASFLIYRVIYNEYHNGYDPFDKLVYIDKDGKTVLPLVLSLDEPELHLNPYLQRTLISYYKKLLSNEDEEFLAIIKNDFSIDYLDSTLLVVTHSTEALVDDYKSIIRFYKKTNGNGVASGAALNLKPNISKHLSMMFSDIKESFFCKKAIIVEGITEYGAFKKFAESLKTPLDNEGICLINAQGEGSISKIRTLLNAFKIECFAVYDGDVKQMIKEKFSHNFFTEEVCFEMEIVKMLVKNKEFSLLEEIASLLPGASAQVFDDAYCQKTFEKIGYQKKIKKPFHLKDLKHDDLKFYEAIYFTLFYRKKGLYLGRIIASHLPANLIPKSYTNVIKASTNEQSKAEDIRQEENVSENKERI